MGHHRHHKHHPKHHHPHEGQQTFSPPIKNDKGFMRFLKGDLLWILINTCLYVALVFLLKEMLGKFHFYQVKFLSILIIGLCFSLGTRIIYGLIYNKRIYLGSDIFIFWTFAYGFSIWFFEFLKNLFILRFEWTFLSNSIIGAIFMGVGIHIAIRILQRIEIGISKPKMIRAPSQIMSGVLLIVLGVLAFRFSTIIFLDWLKWGEGLAWSWVLGLGLIIAGFLTLVAWWRNNVSMFTSKHTVNWN